MRLDVVIGVSAQQLAGLSSRLRSTQPRRRGRMWALSLERRVGLVCAALRTNLTLRELAALFAISKSQVHRVVADLTPQLAALMMPPRINRHTWIVDGTLIPTRDHAVAGKSKNYRWSCNAQILVRALDLHVLAVSAGGSGNRNDVVHYRGSRIEALCRAHGHVLADGGYRGVPELRTPAFRGGRVVRDGRWRRHRRRRARVEHAIARLKDWRVLRDHRRRGGHVETTIQAVAFLHNLRLEMRDRS